MEALLVLEDGRLFRGISFGAVGERVGEVVFNTGMTGYQEVLTDPSYSGQIVVMTCAEIGNYGTNAQDHESARPFVDGFVVREISTWPSNWRANQGLPQYLREHDIPAIAGIDTRALTRHIRSAGAMKGVLSSVDRDPESLRHKVREAPDLAEQDLVGRVTCREPYAWRELRAEPWRTGVGAGDGRAPIPLVAYDFGVKRNSLRMLAECGFDVTVVPAHTPASAVLARRPAAVFLSNGPGDPAVLAGPIAAVRELIGQVPLFGICLGHQLLALGLGARTFKLKFGHHGVNHPVQDLRDRRVAVTSQNHGYAVDPDSLPATAEMTHVSLNDGTCEGFLVREAGIMAVQYHPESAPGPHDAHHLFGDFLRFVNADRESRAGEDKP